jgi:hypothetical protein
MGVVVGIPVQNVLIVHLVDVTEAFAILSKGYGHPVLSKAEKFQKFRFFRGLADSYLKPCKLKRTGDKLSVRSPYPLNEGLDRFLHVIVLAEDRGMNSPFNLRGRTDRDRGMNHGESWFKVLLIVLNDVYKLIRIGDADMKDRAIRRRSACCPTYCCIIPMQILTRILDDLIKRPPCFT